MTASADDRRLGLDRRITRRDFCNGAVAGAGLALLHGKPPAEEAPGGDPWTGPAGVGDYARANGNTQEVITAAHRIRDGDFTGPTLPATDTGEVFDLVVIGAGFAGLSAALHFRKLAGAERTCLILDNHRLFGGEAKRNELRVDGHHLIAPQGSNDFVIPAEGWRSELYDELGLPRTFEYQPVPELTRPLEFSRDHYLQIRNDEFEGSGLFFAGNGGRWVHNPWVNELVDTPLPESLRRDLMKARLSEARPHQGEDLERWLDGMSYESYLVDHLGVSSDVARFHDRHLASIVGLGCDVTSAYTAHGLAMPGFKGYTQARSASRKLGDVSPALHSYPGGNDGPMRHFIKALLPEAIAGDRSPEAIHNGRIRFGELDRAGRPVRFRLGATVVRVEDADSKVAAVTFLAGSKLYRVRARTVVAACGGWVAKHVIRELPVGYQDALAALPRAPILVVNVAVRHWRYLTKLGITAGRWTEGFGFTFNLRRPMVMGSYRPPFHPDLPTVLTLYVPFCFPGDSAVAQGARGRLELFSRTYRDYERIVRGQLLQLFGGGGFDPAKDIAGIVLNRWGHAYVVPTPGFYFGREGKPAARDVLRTPAGRVAFAHSELTGHQTWGTAVTEGRRAAEQAVEML